MAIRSDWNDKAVFSECPTCQHLGPHQPDALGMLTCDVCGSTFAASEGDATVGDAGTYVDVRPSETITVSWIPRVPDDD